MRAVKSPPSNGQAGRVGRLSPQDAQPELFDLKLERQFLASCMLGHPELVLASGIVESDFYSGANARVWNALLHLVADGLVPDSLNVQGYLRERGQLAGVGGEEYLLSLTDTIPDTAVDSMRLRRLARMRRVQDAARSIAVRADPDSLPRLLERFDAAKLELEALQASRSRVRTLADVIPTIRHVGPRLPIGLPTLDAATRGGLPMGKVVMLIGAPGASKTNLTTWLADCWERAGCGVLFLAADEARESIVVRLGQLDGFDRDLLEGSDDGRRNAFERQARARALSVIDPFEDKVSLEESEKHLIELACGRPRVLIVDSLQTVPCEAAMLEETTREQLKAVVETCKAISKRGALVVAISEMARAGYRTGKREHDISALASGAESRAVEYAAHLLLGLKPVKGERGLVDVEVAKNRLGPEKPEIRLSLDFASLRFREIDKPADEDGEREAQRNVLQRTRILSAIAKGEHRSINQIVRAAGAKKRDGCSIVRELIEDGAVSCVDGVYRCQPGAV